MDFSLSDTGILTFSNIGVHVAGSLAAVIAVDLYKSLFSRNRTQRRQDASMVRPADTIDPRYGKGVRQAEAVQPRRSWLSRLISWIFMIFVKLIAKATIALASAAFAIGWLHEKVDLANAYRLTAETAESVLAVVFLLVFLLVWWMLPIRLFGR